MCVPSDRETAKQCFCGADVQCIGEGGQIAGSQADGYEHVRGTMKTFYGQLFDGSEGDSFIMTQEFGTKPGVFVAWSMIVENRGFHYDFENHVYWSKFTRDAFYIREPSWKAS
eukprot:7829629-Pyramimonas_sp.AAC.1